MGLPFEKYFSSQSSMPVVGVDIGAHSIRLAESDLSDGKTKITALGQVRTPEDVIVGGVIKKPDKVADAILRLFENCQIDTKRVAFSLPSSAVFSKIITLSKTAATSIESNIHFEASNYIPHRIDAINLDFQVLREGDNNVEVMLVAVKKDILESYEQVFSKIGLEPVIADVESFCLRNLCEIAGISKENEVLAVVDFGFRDSTISILNKGEFVLSGEVNVGGKSYVDALVESFEVNEDQAGLLLRGGSVEGLESVLVEERLDRVTTYIAGEVQRQMKFFWNGAGIESPLSAAVVTGAITHVPRLLDEITTKSSIPCLTFDLGSMFDFSDSIESSLYEKSGSSFLVALGLSLRRSSDKSWG